LPVTVYTYMNHHIAAHKYINYYLSHSEKRDFYFSRSNNNARIALSAQMEHLRT
jgi:hypothetical protein